MNMKYLHANYSRVYDLFNSNYDSFYNFIEAAIKEYHQNPKSLLELACGTGNILQHFVDMYEVAGLDISAAMLEQAKRKLPDIPFYEMNMADFQLDRRYDVVLCMYDSINYLLRYEDWASTFRHVYNHLNPRGIFIFDMNTQEKLDRLARFPAGVQQIGDNYMIVKVTKDDNNVFNWNVKVFQKAGNNLYEFGEDNNKQIAFSQQKVNEELQTLFADVQIRTLDDGTNTMRDRVFFICQS